MATNQPQEIDHLINLWNGAPRFTEVQRSQADGCLPTLVETLAYFRRFPDATAILQRADESAAAYGWLSLGEYTEDDAAFRCGQQIARARFKPMQLAWFLLALHSRTGKVEHVKQALVSARDIGEVESNGGKKSQRSLLLALFRTLLFDSQDENSARDLISFLRDAPVTRLRAGSYIYRYTGNEADKAEMLSAMAVPESESPATVHDVVKALSQHGQLELAISIVSACSNPISRCAGYSALALACEVQQRDDFLDLAEKAYFEMKLGPANVPHALELFVRAEIAGGRMGTAVCAAALIHERDALCSLLLMLHAIAKGIEVPSFIKKRYSTS